MPRLFNEWNQPKTCCCEHCKKYMKSLGTPLIVLHVWRKSKRFSKKLTKCTKQLSVLLYCYWNLWPNCAFLFSWKFYVLRDVHKVIKRSFVKCNLLNSRETNIFPVEKTAHIRFHNNHTTYSLIKNMLIIPHGISVLFHIAYNRLVCKQGMSAVTR